MTVYEMDTLSDYEIGCLENAGIIPTSSERLADLNGHISVENENESVQDNDADGPH